MCEISTKEYTKKERKKERVRKWYANNLGYRLYRRGYMKLWNQNHPKRANGNVTRTPEQWRAQKYAEDHCSLAPKCEKCGSTENLMRHHPDYSKPLEIITLCASCHNFTHKGVD